MSSTMVGRSYSGFQSHSSRAGESSMESGQESAMACRKGIYLIVDLKAGDARLDLAGDLSGSE